MRTIIKVFILLPVLVACSNKESEEAVCRKRVNAYPINGYAELPRSSRGIWKFCKKRENRLWVKSITAGTAASKEDKTKSSNTK